jgi:hypothetical protein
MLFTIFTLLPSFSMWTYSHIVHSMDGSMDLTHLPLDVDVSALIGYGYGFESSDSGPQQHIAFNTEPTSKRRVPVVDQGTAATSMAPPPRRKPKAKTLREKDWQPVKDRILDLLNTNSLTQVRAAIHEECGFEAT